MATIIRSDVTIHQPVGEFEKAVIAANRRLAEEGIVRWDFRHLPDGMQRFLRAIQSMEQRGPQS
jgi:hypothetical protein